MIRSDRDPKGAHGFVWGQYVKIKEGKAFVHRCGEWVLSSTPAEEFKRRLLINQLRGDKNG